MSALLERKERLGEKGALYKIMAMEKSQWSLCDLSLHSGLCVALLCDSVWSLSNRWNLLFLEKLFYMYGCFVFVCLCTTCVPDTLGGQKSVGSI